MGNSSGRIYQDSRQETTNRISQISRANCINSCVVPSVESVEIINVVNNGTITIKEVCLIEGASCILKSSLDSSLINEQDAKLTASIDRELDLFSMFTPTNDNITNKNIQSITNNITQMINSTCQNKTESGEQPTEYLIKDTINNGEINLGTEKAITNSSCVIDNMARSYVKNKQTADLSASIKTKGSLGSILMIAFIILILYLSIRYGGKLGGGRKNKEKIVIKEDKKESTV